MNHGVPLCTPLNDHKLQTEMLYYIAGRTILNVLLPCKYFLNDTCRI